MQRQNSPRQTHSESLLESVVSSPALRQELVEHIAQVTRDAYADKKQTFLDSLSPFNRSVYEQALKVPYNPKDWYRDLHDIVVSWSMSVIVKEENQRGAALPEWLVTAAIVHDRGYGILAAQNSEEGNRYKQLKGTYWDNPDVRILHSQLSKAFAEDLFFSPDARLKNFSIGDDKEKFLAVVEKHDHPLIGKLEELIEIGRHHFDADSIYSLSLSSFVKDYLATLSDPAKLERWKQGGLFSEENFYPRHLLEVRLARYYADNSELPQGWNKENFPLVPSSAQFGEGFRCIPPVSQASRELTADSFTLLARSCIALESATSVDEFKSWFTRNLHAQVTMLEERARR
jgi:hypothetical protein